MQVAAQLLLSTEAKWRRYGPTGHLMLIATGYYCFDLRTDRRFSR
jgi:hypothetical protein